MLLMSCCSSDPGGSVHHWPSVGRRDTPRLELGCCLSQTGSSSGSSSVVWACVQLEGQLCFRVCSLTPDSIAAFPHSLLFLASLKIFLIHNPKRHYKILPWNENRLKEMGSGLRWELQDFISLHQWYAACVVNSSWWWRPVVWVAEGRVRDGGQGRSGQVWVPSKSHIFVLALVWRLCVLSRQEQPESASSLF